MYFLCLRGPTTEASENGRKVRHAEVMAQYHSRPAENERGRNGSGEGEARSCAPVSHTCAFILLLSTVFVRVPNSTSTVDLLSILNPLCMKRESTVARDERISLPPRVAYVRSLCGQQGADE